MNFRRQNYFFPSRSMLGSEMLLEPWISSLNHPLLPYGYGSTINNMLPSFNTTPLMSSKIDVFDIFDPYTLLDSVINRWIETPYRVPISRLSRRFRRPAVRVPRRRLIRRRPAVLPPIRRRVAPVVRRRFGPVQRRFPPVQQQLPMWQRQQQPIRRQQLGGGNRRFVRRQRIGKQQLGSGMQQWQQFGGIQQRQPSVGRQMPIQQQQQQTGIQQRYRTPRVSQMPFRQQLPQYGPFGKVGGQQQMPIQQNVRKQQQRFPSIGRQVPIQQQESMLGGQKVRKQQQRFPSIGRQVPIQQQPMLGGQKVSKQFPSIGRQVPIQQQQQQQKFKQLPQFGTTKTTCGSKKMGGFSLIGKEMPITCGDVSGRQRMTSSTQQQSQVLDKCPQLYRIIANCQNVDDLECVRCFIQTHPSGQINMIMTCGSQFKRCYTLPQNIELNKMVQYVTPDKMCVCEFPLMEKPRCLDIVLKPIIKENCVTVRCKIPAYIDPAKVKVFLKNRELIVRFETHMQPHLTTDVACRCYYYNRVALPAQCDVNTIKCVLTKGCLCITASIISRGGGVLTTGGAGMGGKMQRGIGGQVQPSGEEKKMRWRKLKYLQEEQQGLGGGLGLQKQQKQVTGKQVLPSKKRVTGGEVSLKQKQTTKLPKPEEVVSGVGKKTVGKKQKTPVSTTTPFTETTGQKQQQLKKKKLPVSPVSTGTQKKDVNLPKSQLKEKKSIEQRGISGAQKLHEIFGTQTQSQSQSKLSKSGKVSGKVSGKKSPVRETSPPHELEHEGSPVRHQSPEKTKSREQKTRSPLRGEQSSTEIPISSSSQ